jgi:hypothetical protein
MDEKPLFVPLKREHWLAFAEGRKRIEYRLLGGRWNERQVHHGRAVVLSYGYSGPRLYAFVAGVELTISDDVPEVAGLYPPGSEVMAIVLTPPQRTQHPRASRRSSRTPHTGATRSPSD